MTDAFQLAGIPKGNGVLIVVDHASNLVPESIDLGISPQFRDDHITHDIGTMEIARLMSKEPDYFAILGGVSRLVVDLNRYPDEEAVVPPRSDGVEIPGNVINAAEKQDRLDRHYLPYHDRVGQLIADLKPRLVLSLHSFTQNLRTNPQVKRPWDIGVLYNEYEAASKLAVQYLAAEELIVGDQKPYSGKELNATMNRHCETTGQPYFGVEVRQDLIAHETGQRRFADILRRTCNKVATGLARSG